MELGLQFTDVYNSEGFVFEGPMALGPKYFAQAPGRMNLHKHTKCRWLPEALKLE